MEEGQETMWFRKLPFPARTPHITRKEVMAKIEQIRKRLPILSDKRYVVPQTKCL